MRVMLPELKTIDEIFGIVQDLYKSDRKNSWNESKRVFSSWAYILGTWVPSILFAVSAIIAIIAKTIWLDMPEWLRLTALVLIGLMYLSILVGQLFSLFVSIRNISRSLSLMIESIMKCADRDLQHVKDFYEHETDAL